MTTVLQQAADARGASIDLAAATRAEKDRALLLMADRLVERTEDLVAANAVDVNNARDAGQPSVRSSAAGWSDGQSESMIDRLTLTPTRIEAMADGLRHVATLRGRSGVTLEVESDQPGVQVYTGGHFDGTVVGLSGRRYGARAGIALETQGFPDAPNRPDLPSPVLRPGELFRTTTLWRLT